MKYTFFKFFLLLALIAIGVNSYSQKNFTKDADKAYDGEAYFQAIELYKKSFAKEKSKAKKSEIIFKIGRCYDFIMDIKQAETWYRKAILAKYPDAKVHLYLADALKIEERYDEAIEEYNNYISLAADDPRGKNGAESCKLAKKWKKEPTKHIINNELLLNSREYDFSPTFADKKHQSLIFTSTRVGSTGAISDTRSGESFSDLYYSKRDKKGKWSVPTILGTTVNSEANEGSASLNKKKNTLYFTRCKFNKKQTLGCEIFQAPKAGTGWGEATLINILGDSMTVGHPSISNDGKLLFFASEDVPGGMGGKDIWFLKYDKVNKKWGNPINAGSSINTARDEMFPFLREDDKLYFASNGHLGMGGLDIFYSESTGENKWGKAENMKYPINSSANDFGIIFEGIKNRGYFTSSRVAGKGGDDIYSFYIPPLVYIIKGAITDVETKAPIAGAKVKLVGTDGSSVEVETDENGKYVFANKEGSKDRYVKKNTTYQILVSANNFLNNKGKETTIGVEESTTFEHSFGLQSILVGDEGIKFPEVLYDLGKWTLRPESKDSLNFLYQTLIDNPTIVIELQAHTDSRGSAKFNLNLSDKRAKSCVDYLITKGIDSDRMIPKGYGETKLIFSDSDIAKLETKEEQEAAHQKNRRTVFSVLRTDFVPKAESKTEE